MTLKVVKLPDRSSLAHEMCEGLFKRQVARTEDGAGEMVAAALVVVYRDGAVGSEYVSEDHAFPLLGAVANLQHRIQTETIE